MLAVRNIQDTYRLQKNDYSATDHPSVSLVTVKTVLATKTASGCSMPPKAGQEAKGYVLFGTHIDGEHYAFIRMALGCWPRLFADHQQPLCVSNRRVASALLSLIKAPCADFSPPPYPPADSIHAVAGDPASVAVHEGFQGLLETSSHPGVNWVIESNTVLPGQSTLDVHAPFWEDPAQKQLFEDVLCTLNWREGAAFIFSSGFKTFAVPLLNTQTGRVRPVYCLSRLKGDLDTVSAPLTMAATRVLAAHGL